jgi:glycosyltransferase involved in cell wall biosynthesis
VRVESLDLPAGKVTLAGIGRLYRSIRRLRPEILVGWMYHGCLAACVAKFFQLRRVPLIWNIRQSLYSLDLEKPGSARVIRLLARLSWLPKVILYNSTVSAQQHEEIGYARSKRQVITNGFDLQRWRPRDTARPKPQPLNKLNGAKLIGRFGRYADMKDFPAFLEAAALIARESPHTEFVLAGTNVDGANRELIRQIERLELTDRVHLLGERDDIPALTAALDIAVSSSAFGEGFPNVVGEAMACAVPVVATDVGDSEFVVGAAGRVVAPKTPEALAGACLELLRLSMEDRRTLGLAGRQRIEDLFSLQAAVRQLEGHLS